MPRVSSRMRAPKRSRLGLSAAVVIVLILGPGLVAACGSSGSGSAASGSSSKTPIKIGFVAPLSGEDASIGQAEQGGAKVAVELANRKGGINGQQVDLLSADDQGTAAGGISAMQSLADQGVKIFAGGVDTPACTGEVPEDSRLGTLQMILSCYTGSLVNNSKYPNVFRVNEDNESISAAVAYFMCNAQSLSGIKVWDYLGLDYNVSQGQVKYWNKVLPQCGMTKGNAVLSAETATDMLPYIETLLKDLPSNSTSNRALVISESGALLASTVSDGVSTGLFKKYKYVIKIGDDETLFTAQTSLGHSMPLISTVNPYFYGIQSPLNSEFEPAYKTLMKGEPPVVAAHAFLAVSALLAAIKKAESTDVPAVSNALRGLTFQSFTSAETIGQDNEGGPNFVLHTFGPTGPQYVSSTTSAKDAPYDTAADHAFAVEVGM